jgi:hypothetical protein
MARRIFLFETDGSAALGFDTGLDARAFAQARLAQLVAEPGLIVRPNGNTEEWKASGVIEQGTMAIWGPAFLGDCLDMLISDSARRDQALAAVVSWIRARLFLGDRPAALLPCAAIVAGTDASHPAGAVFFLPQNLVLRCMRAEDLCVGEWYVHPDRTGLEAAAFTASALLYRLFAGIAPFTATNLTVLRQDMREGNFTPLHLAAPGIDGRLAAIIDQALGPAKKAGGENGAVCLNRFLEILGPASKSAALDSFIRPLSETDRISLAKEKEQTVKRKDITLKTRRFVMRNTAIIAGSLATLAAVIAIGYSVAQSRAALPTTAGMEPIEVIGRYYNAIGELDHQMMEACVTRNAGKDDINMVANFFVISRIRQAYEFNASPPVVSAQKWKETGALPADAQVFGVSDLQIEAIHAGEDSAEVRYRAAYTLWLPDREPADTAPQEEAEAALLPRSLQYTDELTLIRRRDSWRISQINRSGLKE